MTGRIFHLLGKILGRRCKKRAIHQQLTTATGYSVREDTAVAACTRRLSMKLQTQKVYFYSLALNMVYIRKVLLSLIEQCPVLSNLLLQAGLDAQQHLVLLVLPLHLTADVGQLLLYRVNLPLDLLQQAAIARFGLSQGVFQRVFLEMEGRGLGAELHPRGHPKEPRFPIPRSPGPPAVLPHVPC